MHFSFFFKIVNAFFLSNCYLAIGEYDCLKKSDIVINSFQKGDTSMQLNMQYIHIIA